MVRIVQTVRSPYGWFDSDVLNKRSDRTLTALRTNKVIKTGGDQGEIKARHLKLEIGKLKTKMKGGEKK